MAEATGNNWDVPSPLERQIFLHLRRYHPEAPFPPVMSHGSQETHLAGGMSLVLRSKTYWRQEQKRALFLLH